MVHTDSPSASGNLTLQFNLLQNMIPPTLCLRFISSSALRHHHYYSARKPIIVDTLVIPYQLPFQLPFWKWCQGTRSPGSGHHPLAHLSVSHAALWTLLLSEVGLRGSDRFYWVVLVCVGHVPTNRNWNHLTWLWKLHCLVSSATVGYGNRVYHEASSFRNHGGKSLDG